MLPVFNLLEKTQVEGNVLFTLFLMARLLHQKVLNESSVFFLSLVSSWCVKATNVPKFGIFMAFQAIYSFAYIPFISCAKFTKIKSAITA